MTTRGAGTGVSFDGYESYQPVAAKPLHTVTRAEAIAESENLLAHKAERIAQVTALFQRNTGAPDGDVSFDDVDRWFVANVERSADEPDRPRPLWYMVMNDYGLLLGEELIRRHPTLHWLLFVADPKGAYYQRTVVGGFQHVRNKDFHVDFTMQLVVVASRAVEGQTVPPFSRRWLDDLAQYV